MKKIYRAVLMTAALLLSACTEAVPPAPTAETSGTAADTEITDITQTEAETSVAASAAETEQTAEISSAEPVERDSDEKSETAETAIPAASAETVEINADKMAEPKRENKTAETTAQTEKKPEKPAETDSGMKFEVYSEAYAHDIIPDGASVTDDIRLDTSSLGSHSVLIGYELDGETAEAMVKYTVADTEPPIIFNGGWDIMIKTGKEFDVTKWVGAGDYYDDNVTITYTGEVDTDTEGRYPITVTASDSSGNHTDWDVTVKVVDEIPDSGYDEGDKLPFDELIEKYGAEGVLGIDVSKWQGDIDFERVRAAGCEFVIMRIGKDTDGIVADEKFERNFDAARAAGLKVGVYFYSCANSEDMIKADAAWIAEMLDGQPLDLPVAFDWESFSNYQNYNMSIYRLNSLYRLFDRQMNAYGYDTMLYSSKNFLLNFWQTDKTVWLAHYTDHTNYTGRYELWQLSSTGRIDGIDGAVDLDIWYR